VEKGLTSRMITGITSLGVFSVAGMALGLLTTMFIARRFPAEDFGTFVLLQVVVGFLTQVSSLGLDLSVARFIAGTEDDVRRYDLLSTAILMRLSAIVAASLVAWIGRPLLFKLFDASMLSDLMIFVPLMFLLESTRSLLKSILQGFFRFSRIGITDLMTSLLNLLLLLAVTSFLRAGVVELILARVIAVFAAGAFAYFSIPVKKKLVLRPDIIKELTKFGLPLQLNDILHFIFTRVDTLVIATLLGPADIAIYEIARKIPDSLRQLYEPFRSVYFAFSSKLFALEDRNKSARLLNDSARLIALGTILGAAIALLYGKDIIQLIFSDKYLPSAPIFVLLMVNLSLSLVGNVLGTSLVSVGESDKPAIVNLFNAVGSLLGCLLLTPVWGVIGAAIGTTFGTVAVFPAMMVFLRRRIDAKVMPYLKPMLIFCVWAALALLLRPGGFLAKSGFIALFLLLCAFLSVVTKDDLMFLLVGSGVTSGGPLRRLFSGGHRV
jgi:stage V sporulation protein B